MNINHPSPPHHIDPCYNLAMEDAIKTEIKRGDDGTFQPGTAPGPGRPSGSISIVGMIKKKFEENPAYALEWVDKLLEDPSNRKAVMEQIDGKAKQAVDVTSGGQVLQIVGMRIIKENGPLANTLVVVEAPGDKCGNTGAGPDGQPCPGCRACH